MYNFFAEESSRQGDRFFLTGKDCNHIKNVLRMQPGDTFLVSCGGKSSLCALERAEDACVEARVVQEDWRSTELPVQICLFQGLPKGDKMELIVQKAVELGAAEIVPVEMSRCVVKLDEKKKKQRTERWQAIAESAAKQSKRNVIPTVGEVLRYGELLERAKELDLFLLPYENERGMEATRAALSRMKAGMRVGILIGPEGGFDPTEVERALAAGAEVISLGARILRTETAAVTAVGMCMLHAELEIGAAT